MSNDPSKLPPIPLIQQTPEDGGPIPLPATSLNGEQPLKASEESKTEFSSFPDGSFMKYVPRPDHPPQCILVDADGQQICIARNVDVAEFLVNASNLFVLAHLKNQTEGAQMQFISKPLIIPGQ